MSDAKEKLSYDVLALFPTPLYKTNIGRKLTKQEQDEFDVIMNEELMDIFSSEPCKRISIDKYLLNGTRKPLLAIQSFIEQHLKEFVTTIMGVDIDKTSWSPHITQSWLNVYESNHSDPYHIHKNCIISGVFYINCLELSDDKTDGIIFAPTSHHLLEDLYLPIARPTLFSDKAEGGYHVPVTTGNLILFPSTLNHAVNLNKTSDQTRVSLSFNSI